MAALSVPSLACREPATSNAPTASHIAIGFPNADTPFGPIVFSLTTTRLLRMDQAGHERPELFEHWESSPDGRTWTFTIGDHARFEDGREVTAEHVVPLLRDAVAAPDNSPGLWSVSSVEVAGPRQVRVILREATSLLLEGLSIVNALPAGPYRAPETDAEVVSLEASDQTSGDAPEIASVALRRYDTPRAAVAALLREEVDVLYEVPNESRDLLEAQDGVQVYPHVKPYVVTLGLNHRHPVLARRRVRLAMNALVDRDAIVKEAGGGQPAADMLWLQHWSHPHTADAEWLRVDRERARALLDAEGLPVSHGADGAERPRLRLRCLVVDHPTIARVAGQLQRLYAQEGILLDLESVPLRTLPARLADGDFETFLSPIVTGFGLAMPYLYLGNHDHPRLVDLGYRAAAGAAERVRRAADDDALIEAIADLHHVLLEDPPAVHLYWEQTSRAIGPRVRVPVDTDVDVLASLARWTVAEGGR